MENYHFKRLQTKQYMKVVDGEVPGEARCYLLQKKFPGVEADFLEVALAFTGVS